MKTIELFSGTQSFSKVARELGHETWCIEINEKQEANVHKNILDITIKDFPKHYINNIDFLWASPPCTSFSVASIGKSWCGNYHPKRVQTALGMAYVLKTIELIQQLNPKYWVIENPRGVLRKMAITKIEYSVFGSPQQKIGNFTGQQKLERWSA